MSKGYEGKPHKKVSLGEVVKTFLSDENQLLPEERPGIDPTSLKRTAQGAALAAGVSLGLTTEADAQQKKVPTIERVLGEYERTDAPFSTHDIDELTINLIREASTQPNEGQLAVVQITIARALSGRKEFGDGTILGTVRKKNQFSWTLKSDLREIRPEEQNAAKNHSATLAFLLSGLNKKAAVQKLSEITGLPENCYFYKRTDWDENDPNETRMSEDTKEMFRSFKKVKEIGDHSFYVE